ncbi:MAG TPA: DUF2723 domain-containing protein [Anaerolineales bacterium]|nr:DUF2723 domain-containing protein [Anaerolineales bacterium]
MQLLSKHVRSILIGILAISLLGVYLLTMAPGLTWANFGSDGGDLIAAAATGGVAHPSGYPLYLLLARLFQWIPVGTLAFRTNLLSAVAVALAAVLVFELTVRSLSVSEERPNWWAGLASAYTFGLAPLVWSQAVITEVYGVHLLFVVTILFLSSGRLSSFFTPPRLDICLGLAFGLGMSNHVTTILLLPLLFSAIPAGQPRFPALLRRAAWIGAGLLVYLTLPLRAIQSPPINWGNPATVDGFRWLVTGSAYQPQFWNLNSTLVWERARVAAGLLLDQAGLPGLLLAVAGLIFFFKPSALYRNLTWMMAAFLAFALLYGTSDSFVYLLPVSLGLAILIGIGVAGVVTALRQQVPRLAGFASPILILLLLLPVGNHWHLVDASRDLRAETFGRQVLLQAPREAIVFATGDKAIFTMWYFHFARKERSDMAIVATELLGFDWYQQTLHSTYPDLELPGPFPFAERMAALNPDRPICFVEYIDRVQIQCQTADMPSREVFSLHR